MVRQVPVTNAIVLIDEQDFDLISPYKWHTTVGNRSGVTYARTYVGRHDGKSVHISMHNLIMGTTGIDHVDGNGLNNQRSNLRLATTSQNAANQRKAQNKTSEYKGVSWHKRGQQWAAYIYPASRTKYLGLFEDEKEAARAYDKAAVEHFGEFARLNLPEEK